MQTHLCNYKIFKTLYFYESHYSSCLLQSLDSSIDTSVPLSSGKFHPTSAASSLTDHLSHSPQSIPSTSQNYHLRHDVDSVDTLTASSNKVGSNESFIHSSSAEHKLQKLQHRQQSQAHHQFPSSSTTLPEFIPSSPAYMKGTQKHLRHRDPSSSEEEPHSSPGLVQGNSNTQNMLVSPISRAQHFTQDNKLPSLIDCNQDCDTSLLAGGQYKSSSADSLMTSFGFGYPVSTSIVSGFNNAGMNAFSAVSSRKLPPPEGNELSSFSINNPPPTQENFSPSPTIDILQNSPTLASALTSANRLSPSPLQRLVGNDRCIPYVSPKEILHSSLSSSMLKQQNFQQQASLVSPSNVQVQPEHHPQINSNNNPVPNDANSSSFPCTSSEVRSPLHTSEVRPPAALPVASSSVYPYFTSPNVDLSSPYYGTYSNNEGVFSSKTIQPSRSRSLKSRSHAGKTDLFK